jgi:hypothetical protein
MRHCKVLPASTTSSTMITAVLLRVLLAQPSALTSGPATLLKKRPLQSLAISAAATFMLAIAHQCAFTPASPCASLLAKATTFTSPLARLSSHDHPHYSSYFWFIKCLPLAPPFCISPLPMISPLLLGFCRVPCVQIYVYLFCSRLACTMDQNIVPTVRAPERNNIRVSQD